MTLRIAAFVVVSHLSQPKLGRCIQVLAHVLAQERQRAQRGFLQGDCLTQGDYLEDRPYHPWLPNVILTCAL